MIIFITFELVTKTILECRHPWRIPSGDTCIWENPRQASWRGGRRSCGCTWSGCRRGRRRSARESHRERRGRQGQAYRGAGQNLNFRSDSIRP
jgi:hypothetical protein